MITRVTTLTVYDTIHGTRQGSLFFYPYGISKGQSPISVISNKQSDLLKGWWKVKWPPTVQKGHGLIWFTWKMLMSFFLVKNHGFTEDFQLTTPVWETYFNSLGLAGYIQEKVDFLMVNSLVNLYRNCPMVPMGCSNSWKLFQHAGFSGCFSLATLWLHSFIYVKNLIKHVCRPKKTSSTRKLNRSI